MVTTNMYHEADRKRSFVADTSSLDFEPSPKKIEIILPSIELVAPTPRRTQAHLSDRRPRRRSCGDQASRVAHTYTGMQVPPSPRTFGAPMPSFMTVVEGAASQSSPEEQSPCQHGSGVENSLPSNRGPGGNGSDFESMSTSFAHFHKPSGSISTSASDSSDSSPTTTVSTLDGSSASEQSPGPSPQSPARIAPLTFASMDESRFQPPSRSNYDPHFEMARPSSATKKPRNLKNLAVNTASAYNLGRQILSAPFAPVSKLDSQRSSAPASPSFVKPPTPPRRRVGTIGLTLKTPGDENAMGRSGLVPPTPMLTKPNILRHFQSSPSLPLLTSTYGPVGGMTLPQLKTRPPPRGFADIPLEDEEEDHDPNFLIPQSQEEQPESYPNGPIRIYEDGVDLYYEPDVEVASRYDVIFNVASEVKNPFDANTDELRSSPLAEPTSNRGILMDTEDAPTSPDTPKAAHITSHIPTPNSPGTKRPEYIHIPWEHNTDLVPDLHRLVKAIDERVQQGKRVLVHCQCGVSRSATLIVAYGIHKNPGITVQEAYDAVKKRSKWIGPNMNLIMQLQEFRTGLLRNNKREQLFTLPRNMATNASSASTTDSFNASSTSVSGPATPRTAPLPPDPEREKEKAELSPSRIRTSSMGPLSAGPVEFGNIPFRRPSFRGMAHVDRAADADSKRISIKADTPYVDPKGHIVPMVHVLDDGAPTGEVQSTDSPSKLAAEIPSISRSQKRKTPNFSRRLVLPKDDDGDTAMTDAPALGMMTSRGQDFGMVGMRKETPRPEDTFGLFSPSVPGFSKNFAAGPAVEESPFPASLPEACPTTTYTLPQVPVPCDPVGGFSFFAPEKTSQAESFSIMSPTKPSFPSDAPPQDKPLATFDSPRTTPRKTPPKQLKAKFSSPNLHEARRLQRLQDEVQSRLPGSTAPPRHMDDLDALMSPRATTFTANPFHEMLAVKPTDQPVVVSTQPDLPATLKPKVVGFDPRSPAQQGISPITRNIFDVL